MASSSNPSPCAACRFLRRKCQPDCIFAAYFPPDQREKFANVHKVFGASNVSKILTDLPAHQREDAVSSLTYEADMRIRDPVYGCAGIVSHLQHQLHKLQLELSKAKSELYKYQNTGAMTSYYPHHQQQHHSHYHGGAAAAGVRDHGFHHHHNHHNDHQYIQRDQTHENIPTTYGGDIFKQPY